MRWWQIVLGSVVLWTALWGDISAANAVGGLLVGLAVAWFTRPVHTPATTHRWQPLHLLALLWRLLRDIVTASLLVSRQVLWPVDRLRPMIVEITLHTDDETVLTLVSNTITLTPGTMTLEVDPPNRRIWVHALHSVDGSEVVESALDYERLALRAAGLGSVPERGEPHE